MTDSEDIDIRCKNCGKRIGEGFVRTSRGQREMEKIKWWMTQYRCTDCADRATGEPATRGGTSRR